jgi:dihydrofolate reductase
MTTTDSKVTIHMVCSLDGYIVKKDGSVAWLETSDHYEAGVAGDDPEEFLETIDCYVIGSRTYEHALSLGWPYGDKPTFVLTHRDLSTDRANVQFLSGDLERLVNEELKPRYKSIWLCGGAAVVKDFLRRRLADEVCMTIAPIIIGDGVPFFDQVGVESPLHLKDVKAFKSGLVELWYEVKD